MSHPATMITRRQALARVACLLGGTLSASTVAGVLSGCAAATGAGGGAAWLPRTLSRRQSEMVLILGEHIIPETDTPGARTARVDEYIDAMLTDFYPANPRQQFLAGLERVDAGARRIFGKSFLELSPERQLELALALNRAAFGERGTTAGGTPRESAVLREGEAGKGDERLIPLLDDGWAPEDFGRNAFFRTLKELVLVGYYTSEVGATRELRPMPMAGPWRADVPYSEIGHAWA